MAEQEKTLSATEELDEMCRKCPAEKRAIECLRAEGHTDEEILASYDEFYSAVKKQILRSDPYTFILEVK